MSLVVSYYIFHKKISFKQQRLLFHRFCESGTQVRLGNASGSQILADCNPGRCPWQLESPPGFSVEDRLPSSHMWLSARLHPSMDLSKDVSFLLYGAHSWYASCLRMRTLGNKEEKMPSWSMSCCDSKMPGAGYFTITEKRFIYFKGGGYLLSLH